MRAHWLTTIAVFLFFMTGLVTAETIWERQVRAQIDEASYEFRNEGFQKITETFIGELEADDDEEYELELSGGYDYIAIGVCDGDCGDLDLVLYDDDDNRLENDIGGDDVPIIAGYVKYDSTYYLEVIMVHCRTATCAYGVALYAR
jgi:hypothetical protein